MFKKISISIAIISLLLVSAVCFAQMTPEENRVKAVLEKELKGALEGNVEQVKSCYAEGFMGVMAWSPGITLNRLHSSGTNYYPDPEDWIIVISNAAELDKYAEAFRGAPERIKKMKVERGNGVVSVKVKDDCALAVTRHWGSWLETKTNENVNVEMRSVWMLKKIKGEWKIASFVGHVSRSVLVSKAYPAGE